VAALKQCMNSLPVKYFSTNITSSATCLKGVENRTAYQA